MAKNVFNFKRLAAKNLISLAKYAQTSHNICVVSSQYMRRNLARYAHTCLKCSLNMRNIKWHSTDLFTGRRHMCFTGVEAQTIASNYVDFDLWINLLNLR